MYNAFITSDYTTQVEELDNNYGTAQDWADLHEYEEQEMLQAQQQLKRQQELDELFVSITDGGFKMGYPFQNTKSWQLCFDKDICPNQFKACTLAHQRLQTISNRDMVWVWEESLEWLIKNMPYYCIAFLIERPHTYVRLKNDKLDMISHWFNR